MLFIAMLNECGYKKTKGLRFERMLVLSFGTKKKDYVSDNSATTTFRASRRTLPIYSFVHLQLIHHCKNKLLVTKSLVLTTWAGGGCKGHFPSCVWRWKRTKTMLVLNGCNVVGDAAITLK